MKKFTIVDVQNMRGFEALTQEQERIVAKLLNSCDEERNKMSGFVKTRKDVLCTEFDRQACTEAIELTMVYEKGNEFFRKLMKVTFEKIARDFVSENLVDDLVDNMKMKLDLFEGSVEKVVDHYEAYYTCGKVVPVAQTWRERLEEIEKGMVIYDKPKMDWAI